MASMMMRFPSSLVMVSAIWIRAALSGTTRLSNAISSDLMDSSAFSSVLLFCNRSNMFWICKSVGGGTPSSAILDGSLLGVLVAASVMVGAFDAVSAKLNEKSRVELSSSDLVSVLEIPATVSSALGVWSSTVGVLSSTVGVWSSALGVLSSALGALSSSSALISSPLRSMPRFASVASNSCFFSGSDDTDVAAPSRWSKIEPAIRSDDSV
mmetsp:Transcript_16094/g.39415  ORF Transcript_16094/g.39415 Transcript_16094/m.39415 type:complete len:211 (+) Transcript_16094:1413-2045(+)